MVKFSFFLSFERCEILAVNRPVFAFVLFFYAEHASFNISSSASVAQSTSFNMWEMFDSKVCIRMWRWSIVLVDMFLLFVHWLRFGDAHAAPPRETSRSRRHDAQNSRRLLKTSFVSSSPLTGSVEPMQQTQTGEGCVHTNLAQLHAVSSERFTRRTTY